MKNMILFVVFAIVVFHVFLWSIILACRFTEIRMDGWGMFVAWIGSGVASGFLTGGMAVANRRADG